MLNMFNFVLEIYVEASKGVLITCSALFKGTQDICNFTSEIQVATRQG